MEEQTCLNLRNPSDQGRLGLCNEDKGLKFIQSAFRHLAVTSKSGKYHIRFEKSAERHAQRRIEIVGGLNCLLTEALRMKCKRSN